jgi:DNA-binding IclR family transcriptional regulator
MGLYNEVAETKVGVLDKAMAILTVFTRGDTSLLPQEIAEVTKLPLPTVYRLAQALCDHGMLMRDGPRFRLGMTLLRLGMLAAEGIDVRRQAERYLKWLNEQTEENAELHIRQEEVRLVLELVRSPHYLRANTDIGAPRPLYQGAAGKALLAWLPVEKQRALIGASAEHFGDEELIDEQALLAKLEQVRVDGWATSDGERSYGVSSIAAPIFNAGGDVVGSMTLVAPSERLGEEQKRRYIPIVCEAARRASYDMGYALSL